MRNYLALITIICTSYLVTSFLLWEIDASKWGFGSRWGLIISIVVSYFIWKKYDDYR